MSDVLSALTVAEGFEPTGCAGWTPVDLGFHLLSDARRALVALHTPAAGPADTTAVDYWTAWRPPEPGDDEELWRGTGREPLTAGDRAELGPSAAAFPLFG
jgi:hypothetical protein